MKGFGGYFVAFLVFLFAPALSHGLTYSIVDLGEDVKPSSINNLGQYVVRVAEEGGGFTTYIGSNGNLDVDLGSTPLFKLNDQGVGFGYDWYSTRTLIYSDGNISYPDVPSNFIPFDMNNSGVIAGYIQDYSREFELDTYEAYIYDNGSFTSLTPSITDPPEQSVANAINDSGQVAGRFATDGSLSRPALFENGQVIELEGLTDRGTGEAFDINNSGLLIGVSYNDVGGMVPVIFQDGSPIPISPEAHTGRADFVNNEGQIVGSVHIGSGGESFPFLYEDGNYSILQDLTLGFNDDWSLFVNGLNDLGQIVGQVSLGTGEWRGVLLNPSENPPAPVPEPSTILLLGSSLAGLAIARIGRKNSA